MSTISVNFNLPKRTIDMINEYCNAKHIKLAVFVGATLSEYVTDRLKLANAVAKRILNGGADTESDMLRSSHRVQEIPLRSLREIARSSYLPFDGLTRIIFEDKLNELNNQ